MRMTIAASLIAIPAIASAQGVVRDVAYYTAHPAEAQATVRVCRNDPTFRVLATCQAAIQSLINAKPRPTHLHTEGRIDARLFEPSYWDANKFERAIISYNCQHPTTGNAVLRQYCDAVTTSELTEQAAQAR